MINADFADEQERIKEILKQKAEFAKNTDRDDSKAIKMYPETLSGAVVPKGF